MADYNKVVLIGRLTRDPQLKYTPSQMAICEFGLAVGRKYKTASGEMREESNFIDCTLWGKGGEIFNQYMAKGRQVMVDGRLKYDSWDDKNGGGKRSKLTVVVEEFQFLDGGKGGNAESSEGGHADEGPPRQSGRPPARGSQGGGGGGPGGGRPAQQPPQEAPYGEEQQFNDDDIPF